MPPPARIADPAERERYLVTLDLLFPDTNQLSNIQQRLVMAIIYLCSANICSYQCIETNPVKQMYMKQLELWTVSTNNFNPIPVL